MITSGRWSLIKTLSGLLNLWRFFEDSSQAPRLLYRTQSAGLSFTKWRGAHLRPNIKWNSLLLAPATNSYLAEISAVDRFSQHPTNVPYQNIVHAIIRERIKNIPNLEKYQFKICINNEETIISNEFRI